MEGGGTTDHAATASNNHNESGLNISLVKIEDSVRGASERKDKKGVYNNASSGGPYSRNSVDMTAGIKS
jgi:hypothetical protein